MIHRTITNQIIESCFKGKVILILGARQVGKTTLLKEVRSKMKVPTLWINADEGDFRNELTNADTSTALIQLFGANKLVFIDEAQQIRDIGKKLKLIVDTKPEIQLIVSGSSAFELLDKSSEPLTGRKKEFNLYPFHFNELAGHTSERDELRLLHSRLIYGSYPEIVNHPGKEKELLIDLANSYLYKDLLQIEGMKKSSMIYHILQAIAYQVGHEVKYPELARTIGSINPITVEKYIEYLEKAFVIYRLPAFSHNLRNEIKKGKKYYFYDNGIRNVLLNNFNPMDLRHDQGALWENYLIGERMKLLSYQNTHPNRYFWRTHDQAEIDYIEESEGLIKAFELKWNKTKAPKIPLSFAQAYENHTFEIINPINYSKFISGL